MEIRVPVFNPRNRTMIIELYEDARRPLAEPVPKYLKIDITDYLSVIDVDEIRRGGRSSFTVFVRFYFDGMLQVEKIYNIMEYDKVDCILHLV